MQMAKTTLKSRTITVDDYYSERFLRLEVEMKHQRELMKIGFDESGRRFDELITDYNRRFDELIKDFNNRFDSLTKRMDNFMIWSFGVTLTCTGLIIAAMKFWK
jgi:hypothetical protein